MDEDMTHSFCGSAEYMAPEMLQKYFTYHIEKGIVSKSTTTAWEPSSTNFSSACRPITPETKANFSTTSSPKIYNFPPIYKYQKN